MTTRVVLERIDPRHTASLFANYRSAIDAVLELVDNAADSRVAERTLRVDLVVRPETITMTAIGGTGMGPKELERDYLRWGASRQRAGDRIGRYGQGGKAAIGHLGNRFAVVALTFVRLQAPSSTVPRTLWPRIGSRRLCGAAWWTRSRQRHGGTSTDHYKTDLAMACPRPRGTFGGQILAPRSRGNDIDGPRGIRRQFRAQRCVTEPRFWSTPRPRTAPRESDKLRARLVDR